MFSVTSVDPEPQSNEEKIVKEKDQALRSIFIQDLVFSSLT